MAQTINHSKTLKSFCKGCCLTFGAGSTHIQQQQNLIDLLNSPSGLERAGGGHCREGGTDVLTFVPQQLKSRLCWLIWRTDTELDHSPSSTKAGGGWSR